ncbi:MAG: 4-phosphoerythronate dehydrogenase [Kiritimatiellia bacterium]
MRVVCDSNMPFAAEAFGTLGEVTLREGRAITAADVHGADLLITRSTTRVTRELLAGSHLRFYGSAVIGTDHIDIPSLEQAGIPWSAAPGCNAESVSNYLTAALLWLGGKHGFRLEGKALGVIGVGNVGRKVCAKAHALGMRVLACDPPRQRDVSDAAARKFIALDELLAASDILTCHVPLTHDGPDRTFHMLDRAAFARMRPGVILVNAARGEVLETDALLEVLGSRVAHAVIDTWEGEPNYRTDLLARVDIATPHIAGHSYEGKVNGTLRVYEQACKVLGVMPTFQPQLPAPPVPEWHGDAAGRSDEDVLREAVLAVYDILADDQRLRASCAPDAATCAKAFDRQRKEYPMRREFAATAVRLSHASAALQRKFRELGFRVG